MSDARGSLPDIATIQPDRLIKYRISEDRFSGEVLLPGLWYTDFDPVFEGISLNSTDERCAELINDHLLIDC